jgi:hypothetical protein
MTMVYLNFQKVIPIRYKITTFQPGNLLSLNVLSQIPIIMKKNIGTIDMIIRVVLGVIGLFLGWYLNSWWGLIGLLPLATGLMGWCPAYQPFNFSTAKKGAESQND